jgi:hypothetical protein
MGSIVERRNALVLPAGVALLEVGSAAGIKRADRLKKPLEQHVLDQNCPARSYNANKVALNLARARELDPTWEPKECASRRNKFDLSCLWF